MTLWNPQSTRIGGDGVWWNAPPGRMFEAYYMTLRVHYEMPAAEAYRTATRCRETLGIGRPQGFIGLMRDALGAE